MVDFRDLRRDAVRQRDDAAHLARAERLVEEFALVRGAIGNVKETALLFRLLKGERLREFEEKASNAGATTNEVFRLLIRKTAET